ncbi:PLD nuclease N-terminal domain-containing protein [Yinghuangia soli]|uniref:PLD nuclease N-terminal domain-containing protein n=1 Tax=Yinghuangia soli TaxID=2908204 RepID=A0AA41U3B7_9ACTN|nr:PLD nuclease N-terminal domain-containing protein [Yinghuangia soli]MCF2529517.1 PLD nuclease N-terminal domain-containing protein [Yinghuangia soli]
MLRLAPFLVIFAIVVYAFIDCLGTEEQDVRGIPKLAWVFVILFFPLFGAVGWFAAGRPKRGAAARSRFVAPDDDPEFLASLGKSNKDHEDMLKRWEDDLKRREDELHDGDADPDGGRKKD